MSTATLEANHKLSCQLKADGVDAAKGVIKGATVAQSGVQATGKFYEAPDGKEYPVFTDDETLETLMAAAAAAGKRIKSREDHVDGVGSRAGYADAFSLTDDGRVIADIHLLKSYKNRELVLETAQETPGEIGLSIDFLPTFEVRDGKALMRVSELHAVDIVDEGAITHGGLFLSASVDTARKVETGTPKESQPDAQMAATLDEIMSALTAQKTEYAALAASVNELKAKVGTAPAPDANAVAALAATNELKEQFAAQKQEIVQMKREKALLGFRGSSEERAKLATANVEEIEKAKSEAKDYLGLVAARAESAKCKRSEAHVWVMRNHKDEYAAHLARKGVVKFAA